MNKESLCNEDLELFSRLKKEATRIAEDYGFPVSIREDEDGRVLEISFVSSNMFSDNNMVDIFGIFGKLFWSLDTENLNGIEKYPIKDPNLGDKAGKIVFSYDF